MTEEKDYTIAAVDRAMVVLEALAEKPNQGLTDLAKSVGMNKSMVFRILFTLEERGFVSRDAERSEYALGYRIGVLGECLGKDGGLLFAARPVMDWLRDVTSENVNLVIRDGTESYVLATRPGRHSMRLFAQAGRFGPLHAGGSSQLLLAYAGPSVIDEVLAKPLETFTPYTITDPEKLRQTLERIRTSGYNVVANDLDEGAFSVAAPITGVDGTVTASISVAGAVMRLDEERRAANLEAALEAGRRISEKLAVGSKRKAS